MSKGDFFSNVICFKRLQIYIANEDPLKHRIYFEFKYLINYSICSRLQNSFDEGC